MTEKERIEEIAGELLAYQPLIDIPFEQFYKVARAIVNLGYRKVDKDSIILTKEELVKTMESGYVYDTTRGNKINIIEMAREIERKETAKEILNRINEYNLDYNWDLKEEFKKLCKDYDIEVEE